MEKPNESKYRFTRKDFLPLVTKPLHFDMVFDITEAKVHVTLQSTMKYEGTTPLTELKLNSKDLDIQSVEQLNSFLPLGTSKEFVKHVESLHSATSVDILYHVDIDNHFLILDLSSNPIPPNTEFVIRTKSIATPTDNILEGLYYDYTPDNCPRTIITQCQQHGFQRIVPCIDTMDAKAYYTTTILADKRYTNIITNGDLAPGYFQTDTGAPIFHSSSEVLSTEDMSRHVLKYYNHTVNMAPYLFFLGVGTYETFRRTLEFPDGDTTVLEILAFPKYFEPVDAKRAVAMLHDSVIWTMVSLGPEACDHHEERKKIYELIDEREKIKEKQGELCLGPQDDPNADKIPLSMEDTNRLVSIRQELKELISVWKKTGYKYTGAVYREIAMENSYYGGMENVGNTTIVSSCLCPSCRMDDKSYEYMERVKVHEYYHNINGSQVTGFSPFEIWLNEAVTVHMERKRYASLFGQDYARLSEVLYMFTPAIGPLAQDKSATSLAVEPQGFNQTQELVSVVTYSKAPEFVRMVQLIMGEKAFHQGLDKYHTKYAFGNATSMDWVNCMEEAAGRSFQNLAKTWLFRPGHPHVTYECIYDEAEKVYQVTFSQSGFDTEAMPKENNGPWEIPIDWALVKDGKVTNEGVFILETANATLTIGNVVEAPEFFSFARGWSYFGTSQAINQKTEQMITQAQYDPDAVNKYNAYRVVADAQKARVIEALLKSDGKFTEVDNCDIDPEFVLLHGKILFSNDMSPSARALTLSEAYTIPNRDDLSHHYREIKYATTALLQAVWKQFALEIEELYVKLFVQGKPGPHVDQFQERALKRHLLKLMVAGEKPPVLANLAPLPSAKSSATEYAEKLLSTSTFVSDKLAGFRIVLEDESYAKREEIQQSIYKEWQQSPDMMTKYIGIISSLDVSDVGTQILGLLNDSNFKPEQANHGRTVSRCLSQIRSFSLATDEGLEVMKTAFVKIGKVNQMSAYPILQSFDHLDRFEGAMKQKMIDTLTAMQESIDKKKEESLYNQLNIILKKV